MDIRTTVARNIAVQLKKKHVYQDSSKTKIEIRHIWKFSKFLLRIFVNEAHDADHISSWKAKQR